MSQPTAAQLQRILKNYDTGPNGSCYGCPFATPPLDSAGNIAPPEDWENDPTEAWFRCSLPTRPDKGQVEWGEDAPCTPEQWWELIVDLARQEGPLPQPVQGRIYAVQTETHELAALRLLRGWMVLGGPSLTDDEVVRVVSELELFYEGTAPPARFYPLTLTDQASR